MTKDEALKLALNYLWEHKKGAHIIAAIREALAQPEQEPVAWSYWQSCLNDDGTQTAPWVHRLSKFQPSESIINKDITPLYTTPPQQPVSNPDELAQPEQEPVAYSYTSRITGAQGFSHHPMPRFIDSESWDIKPLYTSPPASKPWVGLTEEETGHWSADFLAGAKWAEAKLREKNT